MDKNIKFLAIDPYDSSNIITPVENEVRGRDFIEWGENNLYPQYVESLYKEVPTLQSIINGIADYTCGDGIISHIPYLTDERMSKLVKGIAHQIGIYGGFALNVLRSKLGNIADIRLVDLKKLRTDKAQNTFYYSDDFCIKSYGRCKYLVYPRFTTLDNDVKSSIYYSNESFFNVYPQPMYASAVKACETEKQIDEFLLNSICNGLSSTVIVNFNNGVPSPELQEEIEDNFNEKFSGANNAGRVMISFNDDKENAVTTEKLDVNDYADKLNSVADRARQEIFTAFRANPNLFSINTVNNGFAQEDFESTFKLFNRTTISPIQQQIIRAFDSITGIENSIEIMPFSIKFDND